MTSAQTTPKSLLTRLTVYIAVLQPINFALALLINFRLNASAAAQTQCIPVNHAGLIMIAIGAVSGLMALIGLIQAIAQRNGHDIKKGLILLATCYFVALISLGVANFIGIGCTATP